MTSERASTTSEPRDRSEPAKRRARARVGEFEGRSPSIDIVALAAMLHMRPLYLQFGPVRAMYDRVFARFGFA